MEGRSRLAVINLVGLSASLLERGMPRLRAFAERHGRQSFRPAFPAVTCTAQASMLTGLDPGRHGIVGNGWYDREDAEVRFWKQSNHLVRGPKVWELLRERTSGFTCAKLFWWYNMYSSADFAITPRPLYPSDGRKVFDIHTQPMGLREEIKAALGDFPFPAFWGPAAGIGSSQWIADSARWVEERHQPDLNLVYLPHLDYCLQREGPEGPTVDAELAAIDEVAGRLIQFLEAAGVGVMVVSEYGISPVRRAIALNRVFRKEGWIQVKDELGRETLDAGGCRAFAVADHQVAHVYVNDRGLIPAVRARLEAVDGIDAVLGGSELWGAGVGGDRGGDLVAVADSDSWFSYAYWEDDDRAPDFARTIDIHRKPGYDPVELFVDPALRFPRLKVAAHLMRKKLGLRGLLEVIPLDDTLVRGSHGRDQVDPGEQPVVLGSPVEVASAADIQRAILAHWDEGLAP